MGAERPSDAPDDERANEQPASGQPSDAPSPGPRIPPDDPKDHETGKRYAAVVALDHAPLVVTVADGEVASDYAPASLIARLAERVHEVLRDMGGGWPPMLFGALPTSSMTLYFGDPRPENAQAQLPVEITLSHARTVAQLIDLEGDELFARALEIGAPANAYSKLAHFVESEGVTLSWKPRDDTAHKLTPPRAARQFARLSAEPPRQDRPMTINGVLYRVIAEPQDSHLGTVGIKLHDWSARPPRRQRGARVLAAYDKTEVADAIKAGLIGEPVEARLLVRHAVPLTTIDPERVQLIVDHIESGPSEDSRLGPRLVEDDDELE